MKRLLLLFLVSFPVQADTILLLGDSIRRGYDEYVKEELPCAVWDEDNGRYLGYTLREVSPGKTHLDVWLETYNPTVVHFNNGLWDAKRREPLRKYRRQLRRVIRTIIDFGAMPLFSETTPAPMARPEERDKRIRTYNAHARRVMQSEGVPFLRLHNFMLPYDGYHGRPSWHPLCNRRNGCRISDNIHYIDGGYRIIAGQVSDFIKLYASCD